MIKNNSKYGKRGALILSLLLFAVSIVCLLHSMPVEAGVSFASGGVVFPFGSATYINITGLKADGTSVTLPATGGAFTYVVDDNFTILRFPTLTGAVTMNLTIPAALKAGAMIMVQVPVTAAEVFTPGTGFTSPTFAGVAGKTKTCLFVYDGVTFKPTGVAFQID